ncbi:hypothetical protein [Bradyrhizobium liaoningense]|uniref:hypothetical protein n=1 Tax=Bradyrhizobium liaoningense TaxID=43992 RepID=UPI001BA80797|nr:hypothetical protein [Bradyrhizobium liaoningense]MBR0712682.1 hypothetical protein [Bradyrhizobium liaoningense]
MTEQPINLAAARDKRDIRKVAAELAEFYTSQPVAVAEAVVGAIQDGHPFMTAYLVGKQVRDAISAAPGVAAMSDADVLAIVMDRVLSRDDVNERHTEPGIAVTHS